MRQSDHHILHIDDDPCFTRLIHARLKSYGMVTTPVNDAAFAMEQLTHGGYRLALIDIDMPATSGLEILGDIKRYDAGIQVIMLTGLVTQAAATQSCRMGAEACFFKPIDDFRPLVEAIQHAFRKINWWAATIDHLSHRRRVEPATASSLSAADPTST